MDFQKQIDQRINDILNDKTEKKLAFHILLVSDGNSRLSPLRGYAALDFFKNVYRTMADVTVTTMTSNGFLREQPDLHKYNVLWIDNVTNPKFIHDLNGTLEAYETKFAAALWKFRLMPESKTSKLKASSAALCATSACA